MERLENISIVLVEPKGPGNIGSVARAMKNTGFSSLVLVNPVDFMVDEAYAMACGAKDLLLRAEVFETLEEALRGYHFIVGTTRRKGKWRHPIYPFKEVAPRVLEFAERNRVAILFGREDKGLKNDELARCGVLAEIPADEGYPSFNLSHAVLLCCYELFSSQRPVSSGAIRLASGEEVERMYAHIERVLEALGYGEEGLVGTVMRNLRRLFGRTGLMKKEVNMIRGLCTRLERRLKWSGEEKGP